MQIIQEGHPRVARVRARHTKRLFGALAAAGLTALAAAPAASATVVYGGTLKSPTAKKRTCDNRLVPGKRGVAMRRVTSADSGLVRARLGARRGDWDVAIFDARSKRLVAASSYFGSKELAEGAVFDGQRLVIQACRRKGKARRATLDVRTIALDQGVQEKIQLVRVKATSHAERTRLASSGFDLTEHGRGDYLDVLAHGAGDLERLRREKFTYEVVLEDVVAADQATLRSSRGSRRTSPGDGTPLEGTRAPVMPSGRVAYRHLWDYTDDMKKLVEEYGHEGYIRPITLNHPSLEGRAIQGIEIAKDVKASDGRPVFLQMGVHHAREWPSGEHAIEFGFDLLKNRQATAVQFGDRTVDVKSLLESTRTIIVPIVNPDGFNLSREAALDGQQGVMPGGTPGTIPHTLAYKRKNCRVTDGLIPAEGDCGKAASFAGVDPNRNYGGFWGGAGASGDTQNETYWGAGPFSEPETQSVRELVSQRQVVTLITNHTYSDLVLRPPGLKAQGETFDDHGHYKPLGDAMAEENGYASQPSYDLYDTTGTTEDWSYYATGGLGFTFEIGKGEGLALTGAGFHPVYPVGVPAEYYGKGPYAGRGNRSAYFVALENAADEAHHSVIRGETKPGRRLELTKSFQTLTSPRDHDKDPSTPDEPLSLTDTLETTMRVGDDGRFEWHVNPSTRPNVAKGQTGREVDGRPQSEPRTFKTSGQPFVPAGGVYVPGTYEDVPFSVPATEDNGATTLRIEYPFQVGSASDLDLYVYRKMADGSYEQIGSSTTDNSATAKCTLFPTGECKFEEAVVPDLANGEFKFRVGNWLSTSTDWQGRMTFAAPVARPTIAPGTESWTLKCLNPGGKLVSERAVTVARGEIVDVGDVCDKPKSSK